MAFDFSFDLDNRLVYIKASVSIDFVSITEAMKALLSDDRFSKDMRILVDIRDVDYVISEPEILTLLHSPIWRAIIDGHKVATVAGKPAQFGMANVLARRTGDAAGIETFYSIEEALSWLGVDQAPIGPVKAH
jgi:hypothetical protein